MAVYTHETSTRAYVTRGENALKTQTRRLRRAEPKYFGSSVERRRGLNEGNKNIYKCAARRRKKKFKLKRVRAGRLIHGSHTHRRTRRDLYVNGALFPFFPRSVQKRIKRKREKGKRPTFALQRPAKRTPIYVSRYLIGHASIHFRSARLETLRYASTVPIGPQFYCPPRNVDRARAAHGSARKRKRKKKRRTGFPVPGGISCLTDRRDSETNDARLLRHDESHLGTGWRTLEVLQSS